MWPTYSTAFVPWCTGSGRFIGLGPPGFGYDLNPRPFSTPMRPSGVPKAAVGYQPVGTKPRTLLRGPEISTTAAAFRSEQATKSFFLSALSPRPLGVEPAGCRGVIVRFTLSSSESSPDSVAPSTYTLFVLLAE